MLILMAVTQDWGYAKDSKIPPIGRVIGVVNSPDSNGDVAEAAKCVKIIERTIREDTGDVIEFLQYPDVRPGASNTGFHSVVSYAWAQVNNPDVLILALDAQRLELVF